MEGEIYCTFESARAIARLELLTKSVFEFDVSVRVCVWVRLRRSVLCAFATMYAAFEHVVDLLCMCQCLAH